MVHMLMNTIWNYLFNGSTVGLFVVVNDDIHNGLYDIKRKYMPNESLGYDEEGIARIKENREYIMNMVELLKYQKKYAYTYR